MKLFNSFSKWSLFAITSVMIGFGAQLMAEPSQVQCPAGNATLNGVYLMLGSGSITGVGPLATMGIVTYDGQGSGSVTGTTVVNGSPSRSTVSGTFTVNRDC